MNTDVQNKKSEIIRWLSTLEDESVLRKILDLKEKTAPDWWDQVSEEERDTVMQGVKDAEEGKLKPHEEARKVYGKWI